MPSSAPYKVELALIFSRQKKKTVASARTCVCVCVFQLYKQSSNSQALMVTTANETCCQVCT